MGAERSESYVNLASYDKVPAARQMSDYILYIYPNNCLSHKVSPSQYSGGLISRASERPGERGFISAGFDLSSFANFLSHSTVRRVSACVKV